MPIYHGETPINAIYHGETSVSAVYHGTDLVWTATSIRDDADRPDAIGLGANWTDLGPAISPYLCSVHGKTFRMNLDDAEEILSERIDRQVYDAATASGDDGWIETVPVSYGYSGASLATIVWRRANTTLTHGVGMKFDGSQVCIVSRIDDVEDDRTASVDFTPGDTVRLVQAADAHTLRINGATSRTWDDSSNEASRGSDYRSLALTMEGDRYFMGGDRYIRRYSPALEYVAMS